MKKILKNIILASGVLVVTGLTSCEDFLTIHPTNRITEEEFWQDKNDLTSGLGACYSQMTSSAILSRMMEWGEFRSDNLILDDKSNTSIVNLQSGLLRPTESMFDWSAYYKEINLCNKVLEHGQEIVDKGLDKSLTTNEWNGIKAEAITLRALSYFYLVRSYRNVPYVTKSISTDKEAFNSKLPQTSGINILSDLISQLEEAKTYARSDYGQSSSVFNKGRITNRAVYALLADMYLWRGCMLKNSKAKGDVLVVNGATIANTDSVSKSDFVKCITNCESAITVLKADRKSYYETLESTSGITVEQPDYPLISNSSGEGVDDYAYSQIFGTGNSLESIFEIQFDGVNTINTVVKGILINGSDKSKVGEMTVNPSLDNRSALNPSTGFGKLDYRALESFYDDSKSKPLYACQKGNASTISINDSKDMTKGATYTISASFSSNFIIYRLSDVMLIEAEAIARKDAPTKEELIKGVQLVNDIFKRNHPGASSVSTETATYIDRMATNYQSSGSGGAAIWDASTLLTQVYVERQREFFGEGKRWFDLVRKAEAENSTAGALDLMNASKALKVQLSQLMSFYNPVYSDEIKVNTSLTQNPIWVNQ